jgi:hypothetical protein
VLVEADLEILYPEFQTDDESVENDDEGGEKNPASPNTIQ